ncbi:MAG: TrmH family RNA methyltransferase [Atopobiaceae bacterium]|jgi:tRNA G18 (ribose-2'-O)-methylase SpoU
MTRIRIDDPQDARLDAYARLTDRQLKNKLDESQGRIVLESRMTIEVALQEGLYPLSLLTDQEHVDAQKDLIDRVGETVPTYVLSRQTLTQLIGFKLEKGPLAIIRRPPVPRVQDVLAHATCVAVLENLVDVANVGAIFRSAAALGVDAVILSPTCADPYNRRSVRVSVGTVFQLPWARVEKDAWPHKFLKDLGEQGFDREALALDPDACSLDDPALAAPEKRALFFGSEGFGLTPETLALVDRSVTIPMSHGVDSLNVAASSAVVFWQLCHKRSR